MISLDQRIGAHPAARFVKWIGKAYLRTYHDVRLRTACTLPSSGPAILVCNHISGLDPVILEAQIERYMGWMIAREYYELPYLKWLFETIELIPVERSGRDLAATRAAMRALEDGRILGIFPEGRISASQAVLRFQTGIGLLALKSGAPVYPAYIRGTMPDDMYQAFFFPQRAEVWFGPPVDLSGISSTREGIEEATRAIETAVRTLAERAAG